MKFRKKARRRRSKTDLKLHLKESHREGSDPDLEYDEVTDVLDLALEEAKAGAEACQEEAEEVVEKINKIASQ